MKMINEKIEAIYDQDRDLAIDSGLYFMEFQHGLETKNVNFADVKAERRAVIEKFEAAFPGLPDSERAAGSIYVKDPQLFDYVLQADAGVSSLDQTGNKEERKLQKRVNAAKRIRISGSYDYAINKVDKLLKEGAITREQGDEYKLEIMKFYRDKCQFQAAERFAIIRKKRKKEFEEMSKKQRLQAEADLVQVLTLYKFTNSNNPTTLALCVLLVGAIIEASAAPKGPSFK